LTQEIENISNNVVLLVAFHFPPQSGSSGLLRSLKFCRYLPESGWRPVVLTLHQRAYESVDPSGDAAVPDNTPIVRAFALDTKKHLGFGGAYLDWMALPDRWVTWLLGAVPAGLRAIRRHKVEVIFSTFPITTAILVGFVLHRLTGKPWVVDLRDSMTEDNYPSDARSRRVRRWIERQAVKHASRVIFTAPSTRRMYLERYPTLSPDNCVLIPNGYDEEDFVNLRVRERRPIPAGCPLRLLHTGLIYLEERDPRPFFRALARLKREARISAADVTIAFRAPGSEDIYQRIINDLGIADLIRLRGHIPYQQALQECADADGLLLFQAANCNHQIPAKAYEYLRLQKPIFALTTRDGDTAALLNEVGGTTIVNLAEEEEIYHELPAFLETLRSGTHALPDVQKIRPYARRNQAQELARCLSGLRSECLAPATRKAESFAP
jgi:glycosyltransferase involved in cell wall biosynthesis